MARKYPGKLSKVITAHYERKPVLENSKSLQHYRKMSERWVWELEEIIGERYPHASGRIEQ